MQATTVANQPPASEPTRKPKPSAPDAFALTLLNTQAATALTNVGNATDASGLSPHGGDAPKSARRERVDQETSEARASEAKQSRPGTDVAAQKAERVHERGAASDRADSAIKDAFKPKTQTPTSESVVAQSRQQSAAPPAPAENPVPNPPGTQTEDANRTLVKAKTAPAPTGAAPPDSSTANNQVISVTTAGAARASAANSASANTPAQAIGKLLAASGESARVEQPVAVAAQPARENASSSNASRDTAQTARQGETNDTKGAGGSGATRRADFQQLIRNLRISSARGESSATLRLDPPDLGKMRVEVRMQQDTLQLRIEVESDSARDLIQSRSTELTAALREHNIHVERLEILSIDAGREDRMPNPADSDGGNSNGADTHHANASGSESGTRDTDSAREQMTAAIDDSIEGQSADEQAEIGTQDAKALDMNA